jgi:hypothetical protein
MGGIDKNVLLGVKIDFDREFLQFAEERYSVFLKKTEGKPQPWTDDPVLAKYKFTNLFREDDRVSVFIHGWVKPVLDDDSWLVANLVYARMCNKESTLLTTGLLTEDTDPKCFLRQIREISGGKTKAGGNKNPPWHDPYQISSAFKRVLGYNNREEMIIFHIPKVVAGLTGAIVAHRADKNLERCLDSMYKIWGYRLYVVFSQVLLDLSHLRPDLVPSDCIVPQGSGVEPLVLALGISYESLVDRAMAMWNKNHKRKMRFKDAEHSLCEFRKYLCWKNGLSNHRVYKQHQAN